MRLLSAQIIGFQSFADTGVITFGNSINLIVGQNNAGKSALLRALSGGMADDRHRTPAAWRTELLQPPTTELTVSISIDEFKLGIARYGTAMVPVPSGASAIEWTREFLRSPFSVTFGISGNSTGSMQYPSHNMFDGVQHDPQAVRVSFANGNLSFAALKTNSDNLFDIVANLWRSETFYFTAERMSIGEGQHTHASRLASNASNLPAVLHTLNGDRGDLFNKLVGHLREVFPTVGNLSVRPIPGAIGQLEVRVWPTVEMERVELSFPLNQSGTGVSQIIALLTAIMTVEHSVVIVDEINSFLHPAAVKALLRILQTEYSQHQYIISTHSPEVISFSNPSTVHLVRRDGYDSTVTKLDLAQIDQFREVAEHLGVSMADVFAAERIVWVEGPTEELCFPLLYRHAAGHPMPRGTIFTSVIATGDFISKRRDRTLIYEIYARLSTATNPLVTTAAFSFDSEELSEAEKVEMGRTSRGLVHFLPRRHLECYLVSADAIAAFVRSKDPNSATVTTAQVNDRLLALADDQLKIREWDGDLTSEAWLSKVDAAKLIKAVCDEISEQRAPFGKTNDSLFLLRYILEHQPQLLDGLAQYVRSLVDVDH